MMARLLLLVLALLMGGTAHAAGCRKIGTVCVAPNETRTINGMQVTRACWEYEDAYECRTENLSGDCDQLRAKGCSQKSSVCIDRDKDGACLLYDQRFDCPDKPQQVVERTVCDQATFCQDGGAGCFETGAPPDQDLGKSIAMMEASREAAIYGVEPGKVELFKGYQEECSVKVLGGGKIKSCCGSSDGGQEFTNYRIMASNAVAQTARQVVVGAVQDAGREALAVGSKFVYDTLYGQLDSKLIDKGLSSMNAWAAEKASGTFNPDFSFYGFTFNYSIANGLSDVGFDPYSFALQVAIQMIQEWLSCDQSEQMMAMKQGQSLCVHLDSYCSKKGVGVCVEKKERHCCFNSKLAKIINRQGRAQLGMPMDTCAGFNADQIQSIDFSRIDFSEFIADVMPVEVDAGKLTERATDSAHQKLEEAMRGYYDQ